MQRHPAAWRCVEPGTAAGRCTACCTGEHRATTPAGLSLLLPGSYHPLFEWELTLRLLLRKGVSSNAPVPASRFSLESCYYIQRDGLSSHTPRHPLKNLCLTKSSLSLSSEKHSAPQQQDCCPEVEDEWTPSEQRVKQHRKQLDWK